MEPVIDHIEITVKSTEIAVPFYDRLLPLLGFDLRHRSSVVIEPHEKHVVSYEHPPGLCDHVTAKGVRGRDHQPAEAWGAAPPGVQG